ncbi:MAG: tRNA (adenosine(37)-N6)-dimethylallyltransferase MiaA [Nitratireductor sp.]|nr:tRNA (adenosine(37)-N6)-dimethylallyltransferase MiaA [Nitratireductor sp.]
MSFTGGPVREEAELAGRPDVVLIAGPTASGKSALAIARARALGGVVVNADSMQVYDGLRIVTARPDSDDLAAAPHMLYGHVPPERSHSVARWLEEASRVYGQLREEGRVPVFVGGTGLYFAALVKGISDIPEPAAEIRRYWRQRGLEAPQGLHEALQKRDPEAAALLRPGDVQRIIRALEVFDTTGKSINQFHRESADHSLLAGASIEAHLVSPPRAELHARINQRFDMMMAAGALGEIEMLLERDLPDSLPVMKAIGVPQLSEYIRGKMPLNTAIERSKAASRQYAKRQSTWFRHQLTELF